METQRIVEFPHHNLDKRPRKRPRSAWDVPDHVIPHPKKFVDYGSEDRISSKMGEGTFGQVLECLDNEKKEPVAIKAVRSINKYREAAMIEMDVLRTLASHDVGGSRKTWPKMAVSIFVKLMLLALLEPVIGLGIICEGIICSGVAYYVQGIIMKERGPVFVTAFNPLCMIIVAFMGSIFLAEKTYLGRVLGAVVIVAGLYMVVWDKSNGHKLPSISIHEHIAREKQIVGNKSEENCGDEVITINSSDEV
ncbi:putative protein kinase-like domain superfamily [Helianthus annuus]|nr:putative protein kinase-like domain superfamily [Helianthus annuus]